MLPNNMMAPNNTNSGWGSGYGYGGNEYGTSLPSMMTPDMNPDTAYATPIPNPEYGMGNNTNQFESMDPYASNNGVGQFQPSSNYAKGGSVRHSPESLQALARILQQKGQREDTILAHINPQEAALLEETFGGDVNPHTGLPQYGLFSNPMKWLAGSLGATGGAIAGNMLYPGLGGIIGGALGGAAGSAIRGRKDYGQAALRGAGQGAIIPTLASGAGSILKSTGAPGMGKSLSNYGDQNSIMSALDRLFGNGGAPNPNSAVTGGKGLVTQYTPLNNRFTETAKGSTTVPGNAEGKTPDAKKDFFGSLMGKGKDFLSEPSNLLSLGALGLSYANRPKEKSPERLGEEERRRQMALLHSPEELARIEAHNLEVERGRRRIQRNKYLPEERLGNLEPVYTRYNSPEEQARSGRWVDHYNNPNYSGAPIYRKEGGHALPKMHYEEEIIEYPAGLAELLRGTTGGQDDKRNRQVPEGAYIVDASTTSNLGDGNNEAGARKINAFLSDGEMVIPPQKVAMLGQGNNDRGAKVLDKMVRNVRKHKGGTVKLPPKAKSISQYMR